MARGLRNIIVRTDMEHDLKPATCFRGRILRGGKGRTKETLRSMLTHPKARPDTLKFSVCGTSVWLSAPSLRL